jgi:F0F1-type ATP synthase assembly protein I
LVAIKRSLKAQALYLMLWQLCIIAGLAGILWLVRGAQAGFSGVMGGLCYWLPTTLLVPCLFARVGASAAKQFLVIFLIGEMGKLFLSAILFVSILNHLSVDLIYMVIGFVGAIIAFWVVCGLGLGRTG